MQSHGEAEARTVHGRNHLVEMATLELDDVQDRSELLLGQRVDVVDFDDRGRKERARLGAFRKRTAMHDALLLRHTFDVGTQRLARRVVDAGADIR